MKKRAGATGCLTQGLVYSTLTSLQCSVMTRMQTSLPQWTEKRKRIAKQEMKMRVQNQMPIQAIFKALCHPRRKPRLLSFRATKQPFPTGRSSDNVTK